MSPRTLQTDAYDKFLPFTRPCSNAEAQQCKRKLDVELQAHAQRLLNMEEFISCTPINMILNKFVPVLLDSLVVFVDSLYSEATVPQLDYLLRRMQKKHWRKSISKVVTVLHINTNHFIMASICMDSDCLTIADGMRRNCITNWKGIEDEYRQVALLTKVVYGVFQPRCTKVDICIRVCMGDQEVSTADCGAIATLHASAELTSRTVCFLPNSVCMWTVRKNMVRLMYDLQQRQRTSVPFQTQICLQEDS
jgi:hypothetical protein